MNKKIILIIVALFGTITLRAQTQKGDQLLGGAIGFGTSSDNTNYLSASYGSSISSRTFNYSVGPTYSYFIAKNIDLGVGISYDKQWTNNSYPAGIASADNLVIQTNTHAFTGTVYLRKYFLFDNKIGIRTGPYLQYQNNRTQTDFEILSNNYYTQGNTYSAGIGLDLVYLPTKGLGFAAAIGSLAYTHDDIKENSSDNKSNSVNLYFATTGLSLSAFYCF